jgi:dolichol-phosphate mannosyltransferase
MHAELCRACDPLPYRFEFLFVDDGSTDRSLEVLAELRRKDPRVRYLALSRNFGHQAALSAGLAHAVGDAVITMDGDLQHPPSLIPQLLERWREGFEIVNTSRLETQGIHPLKRLFSACFYRVFNWITSVRIEPGGADFRLMSRQVVNEIRALPERHRFLRGIVPWIGFHQTKIAFQAPKRFGGRPKLSFFRNLRFALDGLTAFSFFPLRLMSIAGWTLTLASLLYGIYAVLVHFLLQTTEPGWTSIIVCIVFFSGFQLAMMGMMGEYIGRISEQVKGRPLYVVRRMAGVQTAQPPAPAPPAWALAPGAAVELAELAGEGASDKAAEPLPSRVDLRRTVAEVTESAEERDALWTDSEARNEACDAHRGRTGILP